MPEQFPMAVYHEDGRHAVVADEKARKAMGAGWSDKAGDVHHERIRMAAGAIGEVVVPVQRTRMESI